MKEEDVTYLVNPFAPKDHPVKVTAVKPIYDMQEGETKIMELNRSVSYAAEIGLVTIEEVATEDKA